MSDFIRRSLAKADEIARKERFRRGARGETLFRKGPPRNREIFSNAKPGFKPAPTRRAVVVIYIP